MSEDLKPCCYEPIVLSSERPKGLPPSCLEHGGFMLQLTHHH